MAKAWWLRKDNPGRLAVSREGSLGNGRLANPRASVLEAELIHVSMSGAQHAAKLTAARLAKLMH